MISWIYVVHNILLIEMVELSCKNVLTYGMKMIDSRHQTVEEQKLQSMELPYNVYKFKDKIILRILENILIHRYRGTTTAPKFCNISPLPLIIVDALANRIYGCLFDMLSGGVTSSSMMICYAKIYNKFPAQEAVTFLYTHLTFKHNFSAWHYHFRWCKCNQLQSTQRPYNVYLRQNKNNILIVS